MAKLKGFGKARPGKKNIGVLQKSHSPNLNQCFTNAHLGDQLRQQGRLSEAVSSYRAALAIDPDFAPAHHGIGLALADQGLLQEATLYLQQSAVLNPDDADVHNNLGTVLQEQGQWEAAAASYRRAVSLQPTHSAAYINLGNVLRELRQLDEATATLRTALSLTPDSALAYDILGVILMEKGELEQAVTYLRKAIALHTSSTSAPHPDIASAHYNLAFVLLTLGDLKNGFAEHEWRLQMSKTWVPISFPQPLWDGQLLEGKTILIHAEQGFGDTLQFVRYVNLVSLYGGKIILACQPLLTRLLKGIPGIDQILEQQALDRETLPEFQVHAPLLSLPQILQTTLATIPASIPYLFPPATSHLILEPLSDTHLSVGIVWSSGYRKHDHESIRAYENKSCPLSVFTKLLSIPNISFYSLQVGKNAADLAELGDDYLLQDLSPQIKDFADTATLIAQMDLVISVDTAVAHLAGALGKPVWTLLPFAADWRWLQKRQDSPWYPTMRLFRQNRSGDWESVILKIKETLERVVKDSLNPVFELEPDTFNYQADADTEASLLLFQIAHQYYQAGQWAEAKQLYQQILKHYPEHPDALYWLAGISYQCSQFEDAIAHLQTVLTVNPDYVDAYNSLGIILQEQGRLQDAIDCYQQVIALQPHNAVAHSSLGIALIEQGNLESAKLYLQQAIIFNPNDAIAHHQLGLLLAQQKQLDEAVAHYRKAIALDPSNAEIPNNLGIALQEQGKLHESAISYQQAITLAPNNSMILTNLGNVLRELGQLDEAIFTLQKALAFNPQDAYIHSTLGVALIEQNNVESAIIHLNQAITLEPDNPDAHYSLAHALLIKGDLRNGFAKYQWRWQRQSMRVWAPSLLPQPLWNGSNLKGKTILLHTEQGFGDTIQFIRYVPLVKARGGTVIVVCSAALKQLLKTIPEVEQVITPEETVPEFELQALLMDLPYLFKTSLETIPAQIPYLSATVSNVAELMLPADNLTKIGLVWASGHREYNHQLTQIYHHKSCPLSLFNKLLSIPDISFYSLQIGPNIADITELDTSIQLHDLSSRIRDFADTAALIQQMDLIISVDTAVAHLAGALGKPVWVLLPFVADWRWLEKRQDSPWYPTMRLFRQSQPGDWMGVIDQITRELASFNATGIQGLAVLTDENQQDDEEQATHSHQSSSYSLQSEISCSREAQNLQMHIPTIKSFSVIIPACNIIQTRSKSVFLKTLSSVEESIVFFRKNYLYSNQVNIEVIIVDDASEDTTSDVAYQFAEGKSYYTIIRHSKNFGQATARNTGIRASKGDAIFFCDADDLFLREHILACFTALNQPLHQSANGSKPPSIYPDAIKTKVRINEQIHPSWKVAIENDITINLCIRRKITEFIGGFPEDEVFKIHRGGEDSAFNIWLKSFCNITHLDVETVEYVRHSGNALDRQLKRFQGDPRECQIFKKSFEEQTRLEAINHLIQDKFKNLCKKAIALNPNNPSILIHTANILLDQGILEDATLHLKQALAFNYNDASIHCTLGTIFHEQDNLEVAAYHYQQAVALQPDNGVALTNLGNILRIQGNLSESLHIFQTAFALYPNYAPVHNGLGLVYMAQRNLVMAVAHLQQAIAFNPNDPDAHYNLGLALQKQNKPEAAVSSFQKAIALNPNHVLALTSIADVLREQNQFDEAISYLQRALTLNSDNPAIYTGLGFTLHEQGRLDEAITYLQQALKLNPNDAQAHSNLGSVLWTQGKLDEAIASYQTAIQLQPDLAEAHLCLSQCLILKGDLQNGFAEYEWRWRTQNWAPHSYPQPLWDGNHLEGKTILLHVEGGFGDIIQFIRYAPIVKEHGGQVVLLCQANLKRLFTAITGIDQIVVDGETLPAFQVHAPLLSLPYLLKTTLDTIPNQIPYLASSVEQRYELRLLPKTRFKVGIVWATGYNTRRDLFKNYQTRSAPLSVFLPILSIPEISFYSLQVGHNATDMAELKGDYPLQDLSPHINDFADTAGVIEQMDLVISVDTAVIHLAGALGKPVWVLLSRPHDWRWFLDRNDTPWYPTMRLFRQSSSGDWEGVIAQVIEALKMVVNGELPC